MGDRITLSEIYLGQSEVENLRVATFANKDVRWFDVAVDNSFRVCGFQSVCYANSHIEQRFYELLRRDRGATLTLCLSDLPGGDFQSDILKYAEKKPEC